MTGEGMLLCGGGRVGGTGEGILFVLFFLQVRMGVVGGACGKLASRAARSPLKTVPSPGGLELAAGGGISL